MDELLNDFEDMRINEEAGRKVKTRKKTILNALRKLEESGDEVKCNYVKKLYRYYCILSSLGHILHPEDIAVEDDKYSIYYLCSYLDGIVNTAKMSITGVIEALGNDQPLDPFCKYLMFTHMYSPEDVKEIGHEEIYRREEEYKKELGLV